MALERLDETSQEKLSFEERLSQEKVERERVNLIAKAKAEGLTEGKIQMSHKIAFTMLRKDFPSSLISEVTGLSETEIRNLNKLLFMDLLSLEKAERDRINRIATAKAEGKAKGKTEGKAEVAVQMLQEGYTISSISKVTGLSKTKISRLKR